jgi:hypothetical protein
MVTTPADSDATTNESTSSTVLPVAKNSEPTRATRSMAKNLNSTSQLEGQSKAKPRRNMKKKT